MALFVLHELIIFHRSIIRLLWRTVDKQQTSAIDSELWQRGMNHRDESMPPYARNYSTFLCMYIRLKFLLWFQNFNLVRLAV